MTVAVAERLQNFCLSFNYVIPSEVEESLDVNSDHGTRLQFLDLRRHKQEPLCFIHWSHEQCLTANLAASRRKLARICCRLQMHETYYYEWYRDIRDAIARESQLKKWSRAKKVALINRLNPSWSDLGADVLQDRLFREISRLRSK